MVSVASSFETIFSRLVGKGKLVISAMKVNERLILFHIDFEGRLFSLRHIFTSVCESLVSIQDSGTRAHFHSLYGRAFFQGSRFDLRECR